ncbi:MAG: bifunctional riboflavin kinase/FAD synthetase [Senegalia sp. (in: firmicutes)]|uniref:bifunctional riboflavin kinase/FAD synthetase n=1 Tax=Senegalia sp. (in: firmicutes) TaxID=1924098 RepID=UPI003F97528F
MEIIENINKQIKDKTVICLGSFDGLHIGHKTLIKNVMKKSKKENLKSVVFTFSNHPASIIPNKPEPKLIITNEEKIKILENIGIDFFIMIAFSKEFMQMKPENFIKEVLVKKLNVKRIVIGFNYKFGYKGKGDANLLKKLGEEYDFEVEVVSPIKNNEEVISSSIIRELILNGEIKKANKYLGRNFSIEGKVIHGKKRGKNLGFPTANIYLNNNYIVPKMGVYKTKTIYKSNIYNSLTNVGLNPTFEKNKEVSIETYILDFNEEIYDENIKIEFLYFLRSEKKFSSKEDLIKQMKLDVRAVKE